MKRKRLAVVLTCGWIFSSWGCSSESTQGAPADAQAATSDDASVSGPVSCASDKQCAPSGQLCDTVRGRCVACLVNGDCAGGRICADNACVAKCDSDKDCTADGLLCDTVAGHCSECVPPMRCGPAMTIDSGTPTMMPDTGVIAMDTGVIGMDTGVIGMDTGVIGMDTVVIGVDTGVIGMDTGGLDTGVIGMDAGVDAGASTGLVGHWKLDDGVGTLALDSSGNGRTGTLFGLANWGVGKVGGAATFNGSSSYIEIAGPVVDTSKPYTVAAWVQLSTLAGGFKTIVSIDGALASGFYLQVRNDTGAFAIVNLAYDGPGAVIYAGALAQPTAGVWYHVAGVYDGTSLALYVNGAFQSSVARPVAWAATGNTIIGRARFNAGPTDYFPGLIDDVRLYSRALSGAEVAKLVNP